MMMPRRAGLTGRRTVSPLRFVMPRCSRVMPTLRPSSVTWTCRTGWPCVPQTRTGRLVLWRSRRAPVSVTTKRLGRLLGATVAAVGMGVELTDGAGGGADWTAVSVGDGAGVGVLVGGRVIAVPAVVDVVTSGRITFRDVTSELVAPRQPVQTVV